MLGIYYRWVWSINLINKFDDNDSIVNFSKNGISIKWVN